MEIKIMKTQKFDAILAKNEIARELANLRLEGVAINYLQSQLQVIENYLGVENQPSVEEIITNNSDKEKQFNI